MKLYLFIFVITVMQATASVYSQTARLNLKLENVTIAEVFDAVEEQSDFFFFYNKGKINDQQRVSVDLQNSKIDDVLATIFGKDAVTYEIIGKNIIVKPIDLSDATSAQQPGTKVTGKISDRSGAPIPGASIVVKGTTTGVTSNMDGTFILTLPTDAKILVFSFVGMKTQEVAIGNKNTFPLVMEEETIGLEEVIAIGYGTIKKADVTSSVATVKADNFLKGSVTDAGQLIQGKVAGLTINSPSGDPTGSTEILLRGSTSLMGSNQNPLILIDGIPGDLKTVAPQDIETIDVLKDGSAAAIYGTRGTNGVILITTKGATGNYKSTVEYSSYVSTQTIAKKLDMSTAADFRAQIASGDRINHTVDATTGKITDSYPMPDRGANTDWLKAITRTPLTQSHNLTFRGGNATTNYLVNCNYNNSEGLFLKSYNQVFSGHVDFNHSMFDNKVKVNINMFSSSAKWNGFNQNIYREALMQNPTSPIKNADGTWFQELTKFDYQSPVSDMYESDGQTNNQTTRYKGSVVYTPVTGLKLSGIFSFGKNTSQNGYAETKQNASTLRNSKNGYANIGGSETIDRLAELTAEYKKSINNHNFMILGGYSYSEKDYDDYYMENWDFPTDKFGYNDIGLGQAISSGKYEGLIKNYRDSKNLVGLFSRLTYNYNEKYLFMASIRSEEASQLWGTKNPWGTFPAVSVGWRITKESFMSNQKLFNDIKLRAGYGVTGSQPSDLFKAVGIIDYGYGNILSNGKWLKTLVPSQNANPDLKWEEKRETDFGVDFSMLNNRISGSVDYYNRQIHNLLWLYDVPSPPNLYNRTLANVGVMENKGIEVMLNFVPVKNKDFEWNTSASYSTNTNKLKSLSNDIYKLSTDYLQLGGIFPPIQTFSHLLKVGGPVGDFYGYKVIDIDTDGQWIYEGQDGKPVKYADFGHSFQDKKVIGNGLPKFYLGWNNNFRYKNWDLSITQRGAFGFQIANLQRMMFENPTMDQYNVLSNAYAKVFGKAQLQSVPEFNSYYVEDGDYWKIDNITLGYNFNKTGIKFIQSVKIYASVLNALVITGYKGLDPEVILRPGATSAQSGVVSVQTSGLTPGLDSPYKYPTTRTFTVGLNVTF